ncbi:hypothetical protein SAMN04488543_4358 [Friedmanniella luteola]|uniref:Secreted protein n=1 Tax=Friedmanniella luteola TaxID=546871 RepID=A0A1H2AB23_9ACTN|nr:DUF6049 family protein [Friedmanniella luteola]SDT43195.1 hypothetical protein SAMN04488543_4358 [Friedmanniella luteola]
MRALRVLLALLAGCAALLGPLGPAPSAAAAEPEALVRITLTAMTPALPERDGTITLTGRVENVTDERLFRLQAIFWRDQAPITGAEGVEQALASESNVPLGNRHTPVYQDLYTPDDPYLQPGATADFTLTARVADLQLSPADGLYLIGVHVLQNGNTTAVGRTRTFVPVLAEPPGASLRMTSLVVLGSRPSQLRRGVLTDDHLADEVRPGGRLSALLAAADSDAVSFAVDPALVEELTTMRAGYAVQTGDGSTAPGRGQADAAAWLQRFSRVRDDRDGFRLLYGSPDIAALVHDRQTRVLDAAAAASRRVEATASLPLLVLPADGLADEATLRAAERLEPAAVVLSDRSVTDGDEPLLGGGDRPPVVRFSSAASGGGPGPDPRNTPVQVRQRSLADTWVQASEATDGVTRGRVRLVSATNQVQGEDPGVAAPWIRRTTLSDLLSGTPARWDGRLSYPAEAREAELTSGQLATLRGFAASWSTYAELLVDGDAVEIAGQAAVARAASTAWRDEERLRSPWLETQQDALDATLEDQLLISTNPKVSTIAQDGVVFPITVENQLPADPDDPEAGAVRLRLVFVSDNRQRLRIAPIELGDVRDGVRMIRAGDSYTANAQVSAKANGTVPVRAQLQTLDGTPVGRPQRIDVRVTQNGTTGWAIAAAALVVFAGSTALRIRQVNRTRARAAELAAAAPPAPSGLTSAPPPEAPPASRPDPTDA